jgi:DNA-binding CsgD family transcriptional regulator
MPDQTPTHHYPAKRPRPSQAAQDAPKKRQAQAIDFAPEVLNIQQTAIDNPLELKRRPRPAYKSARPMTTAGMSALVTKGVRRPLQPGDGFHADTVIAARRREVSRLSLDGYSIREIADALGVSDGTVAGDRKWALEQAQALANVSVEALRQQSSERLESSRVQLLSIARGEPQPRWSCRQGATDEKGQPIERKRLPDALPTIADQTAALRQLARVEEQRAALLGLSARGEFGKLGDWLDDLAKRRADDTDSEAIDTDATVAGIPLQAPTRTLPDLGARQTQPDTDDHPTP